MKAVLPDVPGKASPCRRDWRCVPCRVAHRPASARPCSGSRRVLRCALVDVPDQQAAAGQRGVVAGLLAVLDQEVLLARPRRPSTAGRPSWLVFTSAIETRAVGVGCPPSTQPWLALHHAEGCAGMSPPPPQLPPAIRHQLPMPSDVSSVSYRSGKPNSRWPSSWAQTPILQSSGTVR